jgi:beta-lactamase class D
MKKYIYMALATCALGACNLGNNDPAKVQHPEWKAYYDSIGVTGCFVLLDADKNEITYCNEAMANRGFIPASTYKIFNTLISLETGVVKDENTIIKWDSVVRENKLWNADHDLKTAYQHSCVWYYQELARRMGPDIMKAWMDRMNYGNKDTGGGPVLFWLSGKLRISPKQQIDFLKQLYENKLPLSARTMNLTKRIMLQDSTSTYEMRAKTGWGMLGDSSTCWYVGWVESKGKVYYFANLFTTKQERSDLLVSKRKEIVYAILKQKKII